MSEGKDQMERTLLPSLPSARLLISALQRVMKLRVSIPANSGFQAKPPFAGRGNFFLSTEYRALLTCFTNSSTCRGLY
ncbi:hypothetical protein MRB53_036639 [Persea americana]|nr:hypothetical protein MRB53_042442 [Persea americana]KAJ8614094.1 hypothetical protein MRB53_036715 [Persea americana]KAJ8614358.1 hypothetical protein MRB53_036639 [Persea americana]